jgi:hypothetical protein
MAHGFSFSIRHGHLFTCLRNASFLFFFSFPFLSFPFSLSLFFSFLLILFHCRHPANFSYFMGMLNVAPFPQIADTIFPKYDDSIAPSLTTVFQSQSHT